MQTLYNIIVYLASAFIPIAALVNSKLRLFYKGRKETFSKLQEKISNSHKTVWMHCASLGEFEQGRPLLEKVKSQYPDYKIILSFFSPSGYEIRKNYELADVVVYLPLDTPNSARKFIELTHPTLAIFVKYEFWPNILTALQLKNINTVLISGIFRKNQLFFKKQGAWYRKSLKTFNHFFVQDEGSVSLLKSIGFSNITKSGDTRFDRVFDLVEQRMELPLVEAFIQNNHILVAGSTWPKDEELLVEYINNQASKNEKFIFAPHNIQANLIENLVKKIQPKTILLSEANRENLSDATVLIIDSIGILTSVYYYANVAYVGGGFGAGIHNILEPATYGIPIIVGPNYQKFKEANELIEQDACFEISETKALSKHLKDFSQHENLTKLAGKNAHTYVKNNTGATDIILSYISNMLV